MPTTNLPLQNFTGIAYPQVGCKVRLLLDKTSDAGVDFDAGTEITMSGSVEINLLQSYNILKFTSGGQIQIIKPVTINVDWEPVSHVVDLVEGVDYDIEYNNAVNIPFWLETGTPFRSQDRGEIGGYNSVKKSTALSELNISVAGQGKKQFFPRVVPIPVSINTDPVVHQRVRFGSTMISMSFPYRTYMGISAIKEGYAQIGMGVSVSASGSNPVKSRSVSSSMSITQVVNGKNSKLGVLRLQGGSTRSDGSDSVDRTSITQPSGVTRSTSFNSIMSGMMYANSGASAFGGGNHMTLQSSSFDQDNIIIAGWIDLQVDNPDLSSIYSSQNPPKYFFDWNLLPSNFQYNNNRGIEVFSTASSHLASARNSSIIFGVFEDGNNHTASTTHNLLIKHGLDEVLIPKSQIENIWKNKSQQFFAIKVKSTTGGSKEIEYYLADDSILDGASNSLHDSTEITDGNWTPIGSSSTFTFAKEGQYPSNYAQLLIWNDISWADGNEFINQMEIIRNNGVGAGWENYNPNNSYKKPIGYWKMDGVSDGTYLTTDNVA